MPPTDAAPPKPPPRGGRPGAGKLLRAAEELAAAGRHRDAIDLLTEANRAHRNVALEGRLVHLRHGAFPGPTRPGPASWPPPSADPFDGVPGIPEIAAPDLDATAVRGGVHHHGALLVRGLLPTDEAAGLAAGIDRALAVARGGDDDGGGWYRPFRPPGGADLLAGRHFVHQSGGVWTADSPRMLFELLEVLGRCGFLALVEDFLGEPAAVSVKKSTLRVVAPDSDTNWHQDGAFLGDGIHTLNLWLSLSDCGVDAPGLDVVPRRFDHVVETGTNGATFDWSVGPGTVEAVAEEVGVTSPTFAPGDALLFDDLFLHRTGVRPSMTRPRYAIESWFFACSTYPRHQLPLLV